MLRKKQRIYQQEFIGRDCIIPEYRGWTFAATECYIRGCRCSSFDEFNDCVYKRYCSQEGVNYVMKNVVRKLVRDYGAEPAIRVYGRGLSEEIF